MPTHARQPSADQRATGNGTCPHCGQMLLTEQAALQLRASELEAERKIEATARTRAAELEKELIVKPEHVSGPEVSVHTETETAVDLHDVRLSVRQF